MATRHRMPRGLGSTARAAALIGCAALLPGCAVRQMLVNRIGDALAGGGAVYASDPDVELVGSASPFALKLLESLSAESPHHVGMLLALARGYTEYAYAYVEAPADVLEDRDVAAAYAARGRASRLYLRARDYALGGLEVRHPGFAARLERNPAAAVAALDSRDAALMYWSATAWGAAIALDKDDAGVLAGLPAVQQLAQRALELASDYDAGALHVLAISLTMSEPGPPAPRVARAHAHLVRALELDGGRQAAPYVAYAEAVSIPTANAAEFSELIGRALAVDPDAAPEWRLANTVFQRRARWLESRAGDLFSQ